MQVNQNYHNADSTWLVPAGLNAFSLAELTYNDVWDALRYSK